MSWREGKQSSYKNVGAQRRGPTKLELGPVRRAHCSGAVSPSGAQRRAHTSGEGHSLSAVPMSRGEAGSQSLEKKLEAVLTASTGHLCLEQRRQEVFLPPNDRSH